MLKFFRKIRQNLIKENKASKYLLYAIGEIFLVVIGILIALQLNTWKEERQNAQIEINYLKGVLTNLDQDIIELEGLIEKDTAELYAYTEILKPFVNSNYKLYSRNFVKAIYDAQINRIFQGNSIVFEDMKSSGKINFISSDILRFSILTYYENSTGIIQSNSSNLKITTDLKNIFIKHLDINSLIEKNLFKGPLSVELDPLDLSFFKLDNNNPDIKEFANKVSFMKALLSASFRSHQSLLIEAKVLKNKIHDYFSSKNIVLNKTISEVTLQAIKEGNVKYLQENISRESLRECFYSGFELQNHLAISIFENAIKSLHFFVENGADIEIICENKTPLMYAVKYNRLEMVKYLLANGADVHKVSIKNKTALSYSIEYEHPEIEKYLTEFISKNK
jgi:hypothetical protein